MSDTDRIRSMEVKRVRSQKDLEFLSQTIQPSPNIKKNSLRRLAKKVVGKQVFSLQTFQEKFLLDQRSFSRNLRKLTIREVPKMPFAVQKESPTVGKNFARELRNLKGLESLDIAGRICLEAILSIERLRGLRFLNIGNLQFLQAEKYPRFLSQLKCLRSLRFVLCSALAILWSEENELLSFFESLQKLTSLQNLEIDLSNFRDLMKFNITEIMNKIIRLNPDRLTIEMRLLDERMFKFEVFQEFLAKVDYLGVFKNPPYPPPYTPSDIPFMHSLKKQSKRTLFLYFGDRDLAMFPCLLKDCLLLKSLLIDADFLKSLLPQDQFPKGLQNLIIPSYFSMKNYDFLQPLPEFLKEVERIETLYIQAPLISQEFAASMKNLCSVSSIQEAKTLGLTITEVDMSSQELLINFLETLRETKGLERLDLTLEHKVPVPENCFEFIRSLKDLKELKIDLPRYVAYVAAKPVTMNIPIEDLPHLASFSLKMYDCLTKECAMSLLEKIEKNEKIRKVAFLRKCLGLIDKNQKIVRDVLARSNEESDSKN